MANTEMAEPYTDVQIPLIDSHHHLWDGPVGRGKYLVSDLLSDMGNNHIFETTIFVQCETNYRTSGPESMRPLGETEFIIDATSPAALSGHTRIAIAAAIIGFADLTLGDNVAPVLEAQVETGRGRFRGIRQSCTWDSSSEIFSLAKSRNMMVDPQFRQGFCRLQKYGLNFDAWQYFTQLEDLAELAAAFPETRIIVNHTGGVLGIGPYEGKNDIVFEEWQKGIALLASRPNVYMKLGGLGMPRCGFHWHEQKPQPNHIELAAAMRPYFLVCIEKFSVKRCMFESNFPVDKVSYSYNTIWNTFKLICSDFSEDERRALLHDTAAYVYGI